MDLGVILWSGVDVEVADGNVQDGVSVSKKRERVVVTTTAKNHAIETKLYFCLS